MVCMGASGKRAKTKVLIVGASSYVGARLLVDLSKSFDVRGTFFRTRLFPDLIELDITDAQAVLRVMRAVKPEVVVHVAANPSAAWCEKHPALAKKINRTGTRNVVTAANRVKARVVYISSAEAAVQRTLYGKTKRAGETEARKAKAGWVVLRPSLIVGYSPNTQNDRPFNRLLRNITQRSPAEYDTSWRFQPTWLGQVSEIVSIAVRKKLVKKTVPLSVEQDVSRFELARDLLKPFGIVPVPKDEDLHFKSLLDSKAALARLGLPYYSYGELVRRVRAETRAYLKKKK